MENLILQAGKRICSNPNLRNGNKIFRAEIVAILEYNDNIPEQNVTNALLHKIAKENGGIYITGNGRARIEFN